MPTPETSEPKELDAETREMLHQAFSRAKTPVPTEALSLLHECARRDTGGSQVARYFLFWLAGQADPTGFAGDGGLELRRLDFKHAKAALDVLAWWAGPTKSDQPLYEILDDLADRFTPTTAAAPQP